MDPEEPESLTIPRAASEAGIGTRTLRRLVHEGEIPAYQVGDKWLRVRWVEVVHWIRSQRVVPRNAAQAERIRRRVDEVLERERNTVCEAIRMAIGQLADYGRFEKSNPAPGVLLPRRPRPDLEQLLSSQKIAVVWKVGKRFVDNAGGRFS